MSTAKYIPLLDKYLVWQDGAPKLATAAQLRACCCPGGYPGCACETYCIAGYVDGDIDGSCAGGMAAGEGHPVWDGTLPKIESSACDYGRYPFAHGYWLVIDGYQISSVTLYATAHSGGSTKYRLQIASYGGLLWEGWRELADGIAGDYTRESGCDTTTTLTVECADA